MGVGIASGPDETSSSAVAAPASPQSATSPQPQQNSMDLLADLFGGSSSSATPATAPAQPASSSAAVGSSGNTNALMDLLGGVGTDQSSATSPTAFATSNNNNNKNNNNNNLDILASLGQFSSPVQQQPASPSFTKTSPKPAAANNGYQAYSKNGFSIFLTPSRDRNNPAIINILTTFVNSGEGGVISNLQFQAAVPKSQKLQMAPTSNTTVQPNITEKQQMRIHNPQQVKV